MKAFPLILSNAFYALVQFLIISLLSKNFSGQYVGEYFFALAISAPIMTFCALKINSYIVSIEASDPDFEHSRSYTKRVVFSLLGLLTVLLIYYIFFKERVSVSVLIFILIVKISEQVDDVKGAYLVKELKYKEFSYIKIWRGIVLLVCILAGIYFGSDFNSTFHIGIVLYLLVMMAVYKPLYRNIVKLSYKSVISTFHKLKYFGASSSLQSLGTSGSRVYVGFSYGQENLAVFGSISYLMTAVSIVTNAMGSYYLPQFTNIKSSKNGLKKIVLQSQLLVLGLAIIFITGVWLLGEQLLRLAFSEEVAKFHLGLVILAISASIKSSSNLLGTVIISLNKYKHNFIFTVVNLFFLFAFLFSFGSSEFLYVFYSLLLASLIEWLVVIVLFKKVLYEHYGV